MSKSQDDLRDRLETMISSWCKEWNGCAYDVVGVLMTYCHGLLSELKSDEDDESQQL